MTSLRSVHALILLLATIAASPSAHAYVRSKAGIGGQYLYWPPNQMPIAWNLEASPPGGALNRDAVIAAVNTWASASCTSLTVQAPGSLPTNSLVAKMDNSSRVFFQGNWMYGSTVLGLTTNIFQPNGQISESDIEFNVQDWDWKPPAEYSNGSNGWVDTASVALHESGHFFGLDHSPLSQAVMYATWGGAPKRALATDDIEGICAIYPKGTPGTGTQGSACLASQDCQSGLICAAKAGTTTRLCTKPCTGASDGTCPSGTTCQKAASPNSYACIPAEGGKQGDRCSQQQECEYGYWCVGTNNSITCHKDCDPRNSACGAGLECVSWTSSGVSSPPPQNQTLGGFCQTDNSPKYAIECQACSDDVQCDAGLICVPLSSDSSDGICRNTCTLGSQCGDVPRCLPRDTFQTNSSVCACGDDFGKYGRPCLAQNQCEDGLVCVNDGTSTDTLCRTECGDDLPECPTGQYCKAIGSTHACVKGIAPKTDAGDDGSGGEIAPGGCGGCSATSPVAGFLATFVLLAVTTRRRSIR